MSLTLVTPSRRCRVVLVRPPVDVLHKFSKPVECLALGYLASSVRAAGHEAFLIDSMMQDWSEEETVRRILDFKPDVVGFTVVLNHFPESIRRISRSLRDAGCGAVVLVGGHAVSFFPDRIISAVDVVDGVLCGEGEQAIRVVADAVASGGDWGAAPGMVSRQDGEIRRSPVLRNHDLDKVLLPARDLVNDVIDHDGLICISTSRGCYARCSFCSVPRFYGLHRGQPLAVGSWLARSVEPVVEEVAGLHRDFGLRELLIVDDEFFGGDPTGLERAKHFGRAMEKLAVPVHFALSCRAENVDPEVFELLMRGGVRHVFVGLEAGTQQDLKLYGKGHRVEQNARAVEIIKGLGMTFQPGYMLFNHRTTLEEVRTNLRFLKEIGECKPVTLNSAVEPHFGTPLAEHMRREGVLEDNHLSMSLRYDDAQVRTARDVVATAAAAFVPHMNFIAQVQSSVTFEWRRQVPGRTPETKRLLNRLEEKMNASFTQVVIDAVERLHAEPQLPAEQLLADVRAELEQNTQNLELVKALVVQHLINVEGGLRYWTQRDLIAGRLAEAVG